jgi:predicted anti-sigma-YlaC factor YlaD
MRNRKECEFHDRVVQSATAAVPDKIAAEHLNNCEECRETADIARRMRSMAAAGPLPQALPTAGLVWWRFQLRQRHQQARRAARSIVWMQILSLVGVAVTASVLVVINEKWLAPVWNSISDGFQVVAVPLISLLAVGGIVFLVTASFGRLVTGDRRGPSQGNY